MFINTPKFSAISLASASILIITAIGYFAQNIYWGTNLDTSWLVLAAENMLSGSILYVDILEPNPPFSVWAYIPAVYIANLTGMDLLNACTVYVLALCLIGVGLTALILHKGAILESQKLANFTIANAFLVIIISGNCFGQREHIGAVLFTPLIALTSWRLNDAKTVTWPYWLLSGICASILTLIKPYFIVLFISLSVILFIKNRTIKSIFQPEYFVSAMILISYVISAYLIYPIYFQSTLKMVADIYLPHHLGLFESFIDMAPWLITLAFFGAYRNEQKLGGVANSDLGSKRPNIADIFMIAALCAWIPFFIQRKGFTYHGFVATYFSLLAMTLLLLDKLKSFSDFCKGQRLLTTPLVSMLGILITALPGQLISYRPDEALVQYLKLNDNGKTYAVIGNHLPAFPLVIMAKGRWLKQELGDWKAISSHFLANQAFEDGDVAKYSHYNSFFENYVREKKLWWLSEKPQIMVFQKDDPFLAYIRKNYGFEEVMGKYEPLITAGEIVVYSLKN